MQLESETVGLRIVLLFDHINLFHGYIRIKLSDLLMAAFTNPDEYKTRYADEGGRFPIKIPYPVVNFSKR